MQEKERNQQFSVQTMSVISFLAQLDSSYRMVSFDLCQPLK